MTLVSIVTPSFNQAAFLEQTINSVLGQDYRDFEYLIVDGGSTDGSVEIIRKYESRLAWWVSEKDQGQADAINKGMRHARGEILAWLNSDDYYLSGTIEAAVKAFNAHPRAVMVYADMLAVNDRGQAINTLKYRQLCLEDLLCFQIIGQPAVFMKRAAFKQAGGLDPTFHFMLDHLLWLKIARLGEMIHIDQTWAAARYHPDAKNLALPSGFSGEAFRILHWIEQDTGLNPFMKRIKRRAIASAYRVNARYLLDGGSAWLALRAWIHAFFIHPPTALARLNLLGSSLLNLAGLGRVREIILKRRSQRMEKGLYLK